MSVDQELLQHQATYHGFTRLMRWITGSVIVVIVLLALITL